MRRACLRVTNALSSLLLSTYQAGPARSKTERLEFMYKGGGSTMLQGPGAVSALPTPAAPELAVPLPAALAAPAVTASASAVAVYVDDTPKARNEAWARLHGDPMLMVRSEHSCECAAKPLTHEIKCAQIKQQEQTAMKSIRANPVKMDSIVREVEALKAARRAKKEAKHTKKEAKRERKHSRHDEDEHRRDHGADASHVGAARRGVPDQERRRSRSPRARSPRGASSPRRRSRSHSRERRRSRECDHHRSRSLSRERRRSRSRSRDGHRTRGYDREASRERCVAATPVAPRSSDLL